LNIEANITQKFGRPNDKTPAKWNAEYKELSRNDVGTSAPVAETTSTAEVLAAPPIPATGLTASEEAEAGVAMDVDVKEEKSKKRKSRGDGDDSEDEDKAERKRKKKEEKAAKKAEKAAKKDKRKSKGGDDSDSD
jgi:H/ACA ribonucleoprotein complex subunit 4